MTKYITKDFIETIFELKEGLILMTIKELNLSGDSFLNISKKHSDYDFIIIESFE